MAKTPLNPATIPIEMLSEIAERASRKAGEQARKAGIAVAAIDGSPRSVSPEEIAGWIDGSKCFEE